MSHLINAVNSQNANVNGDITNSISDLKYFFVGNTAAYNFSRATATYPRALNAGDEYLFYYSTNYKYDTIGVTINDYSTDWAQSFTIPAGSYVCNYSIVANGTVATNVGIRCYLTDGTTQLGGEMSGGRERMGVYNNETISQSTRFTVATSTTIYVYIVTEVSTATAPPTDWSSFTLIKEP
jgi:hypothetical protein